MEETGMCMCFHFSFCCTLNDIIYFSFVDSLMLTCTLWTRGLWIGNLKLESSNNQAKPNLNRKPRSSRSSWISQHLSNNKNTNSRKLVPLFQANFQLKVQHSYWLHSSIEYVVSLLVVFFVLIPCFRIVNLDSKPCFGAATHRQQKKKQIATCTKQ